ncbi:MAG: prepilin peptidase [Lachnospiraceae bacterium]|nr:prepilin peptidase [Lachnospiraceae bacterium]
MNDWLLRLVFMVSGLLIGIIYIHAGTLIKFICELENEEACMSCKYKNTCLAMKPIGESNWVTEFTCISYIMVRKQCMYVTSINKTYMLTLAILNGVLYVSLSWVYGWTMETILFCLCTTTLIFIGIVDWNTQYIPIEFNIFIILLGLIRLLLEPGCWLERLIGLFSVSVFLYLVDVIGAKILHRDHVIGGGDIKLMAAAGLLLGWKLNIVAFMMGCICGSIIHLIIMKIGKGNHQLAFGPYLAMGIYIAMICGEQLMSWYLGIMGL